MSGRINFASSGFGTRYHKVSELSKSVAVFLLVNISSRGNTGVCTDVIGEQIDVMIHAVTAVAAQVMASNVKAMTTTGKQCSDVLPDIPTMS